MSLPHAILALLQGKPMTGYELKTRHFDRAVAFFWPADQTQIYKTLDRLVDHGWVSTHEEIQHNRPNRKVYTITEAGMNELHRWLAEPQPPTTFRESMLIQVFFARSLSNAEILRVLEYQLSIYRSKYAEYEKMFLNPLGDATSRHRVLERLTLDFGLRRVQAHLDWLENAIQVVKNLAEDES